MKSTIGTVILIACCIATANAQVITRSTDTVRKEQAYNVHPKPKGPKPIKHEVSVGARLNSDGWSGYVDIGKVKAKDLRHSDMFYNVRLFQIELTEKKSPKEEKLTSDVGAAASKYVYGKINNFYALKLGYGFRSMLVGKPDPGTVSIHWANVLGVSIGLLKPYYLNVEDYPNAIKYSPSTESDFLDQGLIEGSAGFSKGLSEIQVIPGGHFKSALHFDFSENRKTVIGVETGFDVEYYSAQVQLLANQPGTAFFADIFLAVQFGKRW